MSPGEEVKEGIEHGQDDTAGEGDAFLTGADQHGRHIFTWRGFADDEVIGGAHRELRGLIKYLWGVGFAFRQAFQLGQGKPFLSDLPGLTLDGSPSGDPGGRL